MMSLVQDLDAANEKAKSLFPNVHYCDDLDFLKSMYLILWKLEINLKLGFLRMKCARVLTMQGLARKEH